MAKRNEEKYCTETQNYKGIPLKLIVYTEKHFARLRAKRFMIGNPKYNQNLWIPNKHLDEKGRIRAGENIDYVISQAERQNKLKYANIIKISNNEYCENT